MESTQPSETSSIIQQVIRDQVQEIKQTQQSAKHFLEDLQGNLKKVQSWNMLLDTLMKEDPSKLDIPELIQLKKEQILHEFGLKKIQYENVYRQLTEVSVIKLERNQPQNIKRKMDEEMERLNKNLTSLKAKISRKNQSKIGQKRTLTIIPILFVAGTIAAYLFRRK